MPFCRAAGPFRVEPSLAHTPQPEDPPPREPDSPDVPPIGDPPPEPDEAPRSAGRWLAPLVWPGRAASMRWARWACWIARAG
ncbi:hypothetical protein WJ542_16335 [Paraburkholderia sp. B3]|uniref:hypothetical protein n=1 Tax=Paraburkholderia sp. B3 TaxID=3134791 RepID=UPI0039823E51